MPRKTTETDFEKAFSELEAIAGAFERGEYSLEDGLDAFERGAKLAAALKKRLGQIEQRVERIRSAYKLGQEE
ncbi:MAG: exodeoxyribonuclease VII small subunit [Candidatus Kerfeldbacteria bacterium]|nr:exodeoxyribonuclease VII small subunit [Candidatus Kerfeldbacteria bacterium]